MDIPITKGYIITTYDIIEKILGEPNMGQIIIKKKILIEWNILVNGYYIYILDDNRINKLCEWYIGNINYINKNNDNILKESILRLKESKSFYRNRSDTMDNACNVINRIIYYSS